MPKKEIITNPDLPAGTAPLSHATRFGHLVFVQGCTGRHPSTNAVGADIKEQTRFTLDRIKMILEGAGTSLDNVMTNTCYVTKREDLPGFNEVYAEYFKTDRPARTTVIVNFGAEDNLDSLVKTPRPPGAIGG